MEVDRVLEILRNIINAKDERIKDLEQENVNLKARIFELTGKPKFEAKKTSNTDKKEKQYLQNLQNLDLN